MWLMSSLTLRMIFSLSLHLRTILRISVLNLLQSESSMHLCMASMNYRMMFLRFWRRELSFLIRFSVARMRPTIPSSLVSSMSAFLPTNSPNVHSSWVAKSASKLVPSFAHKCSYYWINMDAKGLMQSASPE